MMQTTFIQSASRKNAIDSGQIGDMGSCSSRQYQGKAMTFSFKKMAVVTMCLMAAANIRLTLGKKLLFRKLSSSHKDTLKDLGWWNTLPKKSIEDDPSFRWERKYKGGVESKKFSVERLASENLSSCGSCSFSFSYGNDGRHGGGGKKKKKSSPTKKKKKKGKNSKGSSSMSYSYSYPITKKKKKKGPPPPPPPKGKGKGGGGSMSYSYSYPKQKKKKGPPPPPKGKGKGKGKSKGKSKSKGGNQSYSFSYSHQHSSGKKGKSKDKMGKGGKKSGGSKKSGDKSGGSKVKARSFGTTPHTEQLVYIRQKMERAAVINNRSWRHQPDSAYNSNF